MATELAGGRTRRPCTQAGVPGAAARWVTPSLGPGGSRCGATGLKAETPTGSDTSTNIYGWGTGYRPETTHRFSGMFRTAGWGAG